jgi:tetratricopeptide (TPR) repeat protein
MKKGPSAFRSLFVVFLVLAACAHLPDQSVHKTETGTVSATTETGFRVCAPCTRNQAQRWAAAARRDGPSALKAANCYAFLVKQGKDKELRLADAEKGRKLAETAVTMLPRSGLAHYLYAYLTGLEAENDSLRGLELVPVIEREALLASNLDPAIDRGGPDRMLGELYLRAPGMPVSIGNLEKAIAHFRRASTIAPECAENRVGLVEALLEEGDVEKTCKQLHKLLSNIPPARSSEEPWQKALVLLERLCTMVDAE